MIVRGGGFFYVLRLPRIQLFIIEKLSCFVLFYLGWNLGCIYCFNLGPIGVEWDRWPGTNEDFFPRLANGEMVYTSYLIKGNEMSVYPPH